MKKLALILIILSLILSCGCNGYREIDRGYIVTAIGFKQNNDDIIILVEAVSSQATGDYLSQTVTLSAEGTNINEAYGSLEAQLTKPLYFEQLGALIIENSLDDENTLKALAFCGNLQSASLGIYIVSTPDAQSLFEYNASGGVLGYDIIGLIKNHAKTNDQNASNQLYILQRQLPSDVGLSLPSVNIKQGKLSLTVSGAKK